MPLYMALPPERSVTGDRLAWHELNQITRNKTVEHFLQTLEAPEVTVPGTRNAVVFSKRFAAVLTYTVTIVRRFKRSFGHVVFDKHGPS
jgi:hypothetical protein